MRTTLANYQNGPSTLKILCVILLVFCYIFYIRWEPLVTQIIFCCTVIALAFVANKKINSLSKYFGHYSLEYDSNFLYYTTAAGETKIPLQDITDINLTGSIETDNTTWTTYKIEYTDAIEVKKIRFSAEWSNENKLDAFTRLVKMKNPAFEIMNARPNGINLTLVDKGTRLINKISEKIFKPRR
jgi:hypothetical protein